LPRHEIEKRVKEVAEALEIGHLLDRTARPAAPQVRRIAAKMSSITNTG